MESLVGVSGPTQSQEAQKTPPGAPDWGGNARTPVGTLLPTYTCFIEHDVKLVEFCLDRSSHRDFLKDRDWNSIASFWRALVTETADIDFDLCTSNSLTGDVIKENNTQTVSITDEYGTTDLNAIHAVGEAEFLSNDPRFRRKTFAMRIGYDGTAYSGFQRQRCGDNKEPEDTVEGDVYICLGNRTSCAAGRTDKYVSAISQVVSFSTYDPVTAEQLLASFRASAPCREGRLAAYDCLRVPRRFHSLFGATWRRYLFLLPLRPGRYEHGVDVDVTFVNAALRKLEGESLPYDAYAYREDRAAAAGGDFCTLHRARASLVRLRYKDTKTTMSSSSSGEKTAVYKHSLVHSDLPTLCVELVGTRFLRRMVRILVATAVRASVCEEARALGGCSMTDPTVVLREVCVSGDRGRAALPADGRGLCLAGVGYDLSDLGVDKRSSKRPDNRKETKNKDNGKSGVSVDGVVGKRSQRKARRFKSMEMDGDGELDSLDPTDTSRGYFIPPGTHTESCQENDWDDSNCETVDTSHVIDSVSTT